MSTLSSVAAFVRRDWQISNSYRAPYVFDILALLAGVATFYYLGHFVGGHGRSDYFAFALAGLAVLRLNLAIPRLVQEFETELAVGNLQILFASPLPASVVAIAGVLFQFMRALVSAVLAIGFGAVVFGTSLSAGPASIAAVVLGLLGSALLYLGVYAVICGVFLIVRQAAALSTLAGIAIPVIAGAYFPVSTLPEPLESIAQVLPFRLGVDVVRDGLLHGRLPAAEMAELWAGALLVLAAGIVVLQTAVQRARRLGALDSV